MTLIWDAFPQAWDIATLTGSKPTVPTTREEH